MPPSPALYQPGARHPKWLKPVESSSSLQSLSAASPNPATVRPSTTPVRPSISPGLTPAPRLSRASPGPGGSRTMMYGSSRTSLGGSRRNLGPKPSKDQELEQVADHEEFDFAEYEQRRQHVAAVAIAKAKAKDFVEIARAARRGSDQLRRLRGYLRENSLSDLTQAGLNPLVLNRINTWQDSRVEPPRPRVVRPEGWRGCTINEAALRAITVPQLEEIFSSAVEACRRQRWRSTNPEHHTEILNADTLTLYDLVHYWIAPLTAERQCSMVELVADTKQPPEWFVSHWWGEPVKDFIACLRRHLMDRGLPENTTYWVCAYALRQHALGLELAGGVEVSPFMRALQLTQGTVSVVDKMGYYFTRVWCGYELNESIMSHDSRYLHDIYAAADAKNVYGGAVHAVGLVDGFGVEDCDVLGNNSTEHKQRREANFPLDLVLKSSSFDVEQAEASQPEDKANILALVGKQAHALNATMRTRFGASRLADMLQDGAGSDPDAAAKREEDLTAMLSWLSASNLRKLAVYATHGYASAKAVERLVDSLPKTLVELRAECLRPECVPGVRKLVHRGQLETLELKACFLSPQDARRICEALVPKLGAKPKLKTLNLANNNLGAEGAKAVAECLVKNATVRDLNLMINNIGDDGAGALALMLKENTALTSLNLIFNMITDNGASRLADGLRTNGVLAKLNVRINRMDSPGVAALRAAWIVRPGKHNREHLVYDTEQSEEQGAAAASGLGMHDDDISSYKSSAKYDDDAPWYEDLTDIMRNK